MKSFINKIKRRRLAKKYGVAYTMRVWYNYEAFISKKNRLKESFIEILDNNGKYVSCPAIGGTVVYNDKGSRYLYEIIDFDNESRHKDWLYDSDYIHPIIRFIYKIDEK